MDAPTGTTKPGSRSTGAAGRRSGRGVLWGLLAVVVAFLIGFGWQWYEARTVREQLAETQEQLLVERLRVRLGQAALAAQAGDFESARLQMSEFFTRVSEASGSLPDSITTITDQFLARRDEVITGLSRSNPEYAGVLYGMLQTFRRGTTPPARPAPAAAPTAEPTGEPAAEPAAEPAGADTTAADSGVGG